MYNADASNAPQRNEPLLTDAGQRRKELALDCTYDIELADMLIRLADDLQVATSVLQAPSPAVLRMLGCRIKDLNSVLMSYLSDDRISVADAHRELYRNAIPLESEAIHD